jgi:ankyrin repeat protein
MQDDELIALATQGDEEAALAELRRAPRRVVVRGAGGVSLICLAVYRRRLRLAAALAESRDDLDVFEASCLGNVERVRAILVDDPGAASGVSPDGFSPAGYAAFFGHLPVLREVVRAGGDVDVASANAMRVRPLHSAAASVDPALAVELSRVVLEQGADPNARQQAGYTALHEAANKGNLALIELLLAHGADPLATNDDQLTPADLARAKGHTAALELLGRSSPRRSRA